MFEWSWNKINTKQSDTFDLFGASFPLYRMDKTIIALVRHTHTEKWNIRDYRFERHMDISSSLDGKMNLIHKFSKHKQRKRRAFSTVLYVYTPSAAEWVLGDGIPVESWFLFNDHWKWIVLQEKQMFRSADQKAKDEHFTVFIGSDASRWDIIGNRLPENDSSIRQPIQSLLFHKRSENTLANNLNIVSLITTLGRDRWFLHINHQRTTWRFPPRLNESPTHLSSVGILLAIFVCARLVMPV
jgi:hypothetical protein